VILPIVPGGKLVATARRTRSEVCKRDTEKNDSGKGGEKLSGEERGPSGNHLNCWDIRGKGKGN